MRKRVHQVKFRLDDEELSLLRRKLRESNLPMAEYFRRLLVYGEIKIYPNAFVADLQKQVKGWITSSKWRKKFKSKEKREFQQGF